MNRFVEAIRELSRSIETFEDLSALGLKLDVVTSVLLRSPLAQETLGPEGASELEQQHADVADVLRAIGGNDFEDAARPAQELVEFATSSTLEHIDTEEIGYAEAARGELCSALERIAPLVADEE